MQHAAHDALRVAFYVYSCPALSMSAAAARIRQALPLPLSARSGSRRGAYYRWSGDDGADLLVQGNLPDEDGLLLEPAAPAGAPLVYATGLPPAVHRALVALDGLVLVAADVVTVPRVPAAGP